jgi:methyl-accepting chemotaxis protein
MEEMVPEVERTSTLVQEIASASLEQNHGTNQVNLSMQQLNSITQKNAAASEEMVTSAEELASQSEQLKELVSFFSLDEKLKQSIITQKFSTKNAKEVALKHVPVRNADLSEITTF